MANGDKIRDMTDEELAMLLQPICPAEMCPDTIPHDCYKCCFNWLKQEVTDNCVITGNDILKAPTIVPTEGGV